MTSSDRLLVDARIVPVAATVSINGIEITSKDDWDRVLRSLEELMRDNERLRDGLKYGIQTIDSGYGDASIRIVSARSIMEKALSNKD